jgi:hypothetical protein
MSALTLFTYTTQRDSFASQVSFELKQTGSIRRLTALHAVLQISLLARFKATPAI